MANDFTKTILGFLRKEYSAEPLSIIPFTEGIASTNYRVLTNQLDLVIRIDVVRNENDLFEDLMYLNIAKTRGVKVPEGNYHIATLDGIAISGRPFVNGRALTKMDHLFGKYVYKIGENLARIHSCKLFSGRDYFYKFIYDSGNSTWELIFRYISKHPNDEKVNTALELFDFIKKQTDSFNDYDFPTSLVHGDYKPENILITSTDEVIILDWEKASFGYSILDLSLSLFHLLCYQGQILREELLYPFLDGYLSIKSLSGKEIQLLPRCLQISAAAFLLMDIIFDAENHTRNNIDYDIRVTKYLNNYCLPAYDLFSKNFHRIVELFEGYFV